MSVVPADQFIHFDQVLADAAYDGEHNHCLSRDHLGIRSTIIDLNRPLQPQRTQGQVSTADDHMLS